MITLTRRYTFAASHQLTGLREGHKCARLHGHNYTVEASLAGERVNGFVIDAYDLDDLLSPTIARLDHHHLNEVVPQPTAENIAAFLWTEFRAVLPTRLSLTSVRVSENDRLWATAEGA